MQEHSGNPGDVGHGTSVSNSPKVGASGPSFTQSANGVSVVSGLAAQEKFDGTPNRELSMDTRKGALNQQPHQGSHEWSTDRGSFKCY